MTRGVLWLIFLLQIRYVAAQQQRPPDVTDQQAPNVQYYNEMGVSTNVSISQNFDTVIDFLRAVTPPNGYATCLGYGNVPDIVYAHTACYNMSVQIFCTACIADAYQSLQRTATIGARLWTNNTSNRCNLRYEIVNFTGDLPPDTLGILGPNASSPAAPEGTSSNTGIVVGGTVVAVVLILLLCCYFLRKRRNFQPQRLPATSDELQGMRGPRVFSYQDLRLATKDFSEETKLGQGGFGSVYKAVLQDGGQVAVKKLSLAPPQGKREFVNEISIITDIRHRNLVRLKGYCAEDEHRILVLEFLENRSVDRALFDEQKKVTLNWPARFQIIVGVESHMQIIHRDIKASNILLDAKISDFGISKLGDFTTTRVAGIGYMAPEYVLKGQ